MNYEPVKISQKALIEVKNILSQKGIDSEYGLRIGIRGAGCAGVSYLVGFDKEKEDDIIMLKDDLKVFISKKHVMYLVGVELDFHDGMDEKGFVFSNAVEE